jgi:DNA repair protein RecO (recombination protein O)
MSIEKSQAIVLKRQKLRETSILATFFTREFGKVSGVMKGVRGIQNKSANFLEPFTLCEVVFYKNRKGGLYTVSQCDLLDYFFDVRTDYERLVHGLYFVDLLDAVTQAEDDNHELFELIYESLKALKALKKPAPIKTIYEVKTLILSGFKPRVDTCISCGRSVEERAKFSTKLGGLICSQCFNKDVSSHDIFKGTLASLMHIEKSSFENVWRLDMTSRVKSQLSHILDDFIRFHIDKNIRSRNFIDAFV